MVTELGTELGTTLGTNLGSMDVYGPPAFDASKLYGIRPASGSYYATQAGGGEGGIASGFGVVTVCRINGGVASASRALADDLFTGPVEGWTVNTTGTNAGIIAAFVSGAAASISSPTYALSASDLGKVFTVIGQHSGAQSRVGVSRTPLLGTAITGYTPSSTRIMGLGARANIGNIPADGVDILGSLTFRGTPTDAQLFALQDLVRSAGDVPSKTAAEAVMPGTTVTHRWSLRDVLAALNVPVIDGQAAPATIPDSVTAATVDVMTKAGTPVVRVLDPSLYPRTSYGVLGLSGVTGSYLQAAGTGGILGSASGLTVILVVRVDRVATGTPYLASTFQTAPSGYSIYQGSATFALYVTGLINPAFGTCAAADIGKFKLLAVTWDGTTWRTYEDAVAGATAAGGFTPGSTAMQIGRSPHSATGDVASTIFSVGGCAAALTPAELSTVQSTWLSTGRLVMPSGKASTHVYDLTQDVVANGGPQNGIPATVLDRVGTDNLTRVGTDLQVSQRTERLWSYETSPILYGASAFTQANFYASGVWNEPAASPWWTAVLFTVASQSVASGNRSILGNGELVVSTYTGFHLCTAGTNTLAYINLCNAAGAFVSGPVGTIAATDVGKLLLYVGVWDPAAGKIRGYWKRAEVGTGTVSATYLPSPATPLRLGRSISNADWSANNVVAHGVSGGFGLPTLAQVQALFDETMAIERIGSIVGMTNFRIDITQDALSNGGVVPATLTDRAGSLNFTRTGSVATSAQYARAWNW